MSTFTNTINVGDDCPKTPGTFYVRAFYSAIDTGQVSGPFSTRERAEDCAVALVSKPGVSKAVVESA